MPSTYLRFWAKEAWRVSRRKISRVKCSRDHRFAIGWMLLIFWGHASIMKNTPNIYKMNLKATQTKKEFLKNMYKISRNWRIILISTSWMEVMAINISFWIHSTMLTTQQNQSKETQISIREYSKQLCNKYW